MKRREILEKKNSEKELVNVDSVIKRDRANIKKQVSDKEFELLEVEEGVAAYLNNEKLNLDEEFVNLLKKESSLKKDLEFLGTISETYL